MIVGVENPLSDTVGYEYDGVGNLLTQTASNGGGDPQVTTYHYDGANRRDTETYPDDEAGVNVRSFSYNGAGQVQTRTDQNGDVTTYTYDDLHRLTQRSYTINSGVTYPAAQPPDTFSYDLAGRMLTAVKDANTTVLSVADVDTFTYNAGGAVTQFNQGGLTIDYAYVVDANTSRRTITYNGGMVIQENADKRGRIETIIDVSTNTPVTLAVNMYDQSDHLLGRDFGNATEAVWTYDAAGRVNHILHEVTGGSPLVEFNYVRDAVGNPTCRENLLTSNMSEHYTYDDADRLTLFQRGDVSTHGAGCSFGSATSNTGVLQEQAWTLDSLGNWSTNGTTVNSSSAAETRSHNKANEITDITTDGTTYPTYDDNGNITNDGTFIYSYDAENRLTRVQNQGYDTISESYYDALGRRVRKVVTNSDNDGDYRYLWNPDWQLMNVFVFADSELKPRQRLVHAGSPTAWYKSPSPLKGEGWGEGVGGGRAYIDDHVCIYIPGGMGGGRKYFHTDAQYNTQMVTDASSNIAASYVLSAYGLVETVTQPGMGGLGSYATNNAMIHQGLIYDAETGSYYNRNRIYGPQIGRFLQRDPLSYIDGMNFYSYEQDLPSVAKDPLGLDNPGCDFPGNIFAGGDKCSIQCCAQHDYCYRVNSCSAVSWPTMVIRPFYNIAAIFWNNGSPQWMQVPFMDAKRECDRCNLIAVICMTACRTGGNIYDPGKPLYYDGCHDVWSDTVPPKSSSDCIGGGYGPMPPPTTWPPIYVGPGIIPPPNVAGCSEQCLRGAAELGIADPAGFCAGHCH